MNCLLCGALTALTVCQAMSIAITVVLPAPVASFSASAHQLGVRVVVRVGEVLEDPLRALAGVRRDLRQPDHRLDRLDLAEERPQVAELDGAASAAGAAPSPA